MSLEKDVIHLLNHHKENLRKLERIALNNDDVGIFVLKQERCDLIGFIVALESVLDRNGIKYR